MPVNISRLSVSQICQHLNAKTLDPVQLTEYFLDRIAAHPDPSVFILVMHDQAMTAALQSWQRYRNNQPLSPFDGLPIAWKDLVDIEGTTTSAGSQLYRNEAPAKQDAAVMHRLRAAGSVPLGKTNLSEFAFSGVGLNPHFGSPVMRADYGDDLSELPPPERRHVPGGSSCGAAVALGCGLAPVSIGTDTSGSVRVPASLNGLTGHHSSPGRYPTTGVFCLSPTLDTVGTLARSVDDCLLMDNALRGEPIKSEAPLALSSLKLLIPVNYVCEDCDREVVDNFEWVIDCLGSHGASIKRCEIAEIDDYARTMSRHGALVTAEAYHQRRADLKPPRRQLIDPLLVTRLSLGEHINSASLAAIHEARHNLHSGLMKYLNQGYMLAMPTVPMTAPRLEPLREDIELFAATNLKLIRNTMIASIAGLCSLTLPSGTDGNGLSIGTMFCGRPGRDRQLMGYGMAISEALSSGK